MLDYCKITNRLSQLWKESLPPPISVGLLLAVFGFRDWMDIANVSSRYVHSLTLQFL